MNTLFHRYKKLFNKNHYDPRGTGHINKKDTINKETSLLPQSKLQFLDNILKKS